jgi:hypothetical protein
LWREERRTECSGDPGEPSGTDGVTLVFDRNDKVRAFTLLGGSDDHYHEVRLFFDENEQLRLLFVKHAEVSGAAAEHLVAYDARGSVSACDRLIDSNGPAQWNLCDNEAPPVTVDKEVQHALSSPVRRVSRNRIREALQALVPRQEFGKCAVR